MTCEECEALAPLGEALNHGEALEPGEAAEVKAHLQGCASCRDETARALRALELATLAPVSQAEEEKLAPLAGPLWASWRRAEARRGWLRRFAGLAAAACLGGLIASAALLSRPPAAPTLSAAATPQHQTSPSEGDWEALSYEVPWTYEEEDPEGVTP